MFDTPEFREFDAFMTKLSWTVSFCTCVLVGVVCLWP